jgi:SAM-dependent methyltransferase
MRTWTANRIRAAVREAYGAIAREGQQGGCCGAGAACCGATASSPPRWRDSEARAAAVPPGADLGLGCGNPRAIAALAPGERVLDLGSGGGFDALHAAQQVGPAGRVIGVDMTPAMIALARRKAAAASLDNVEFRLGDIEDLPVEGDSIDVVISNCVVNLAPDKAAVFREAFRVLTPNGRLAIADMVATGALPQPTADDPAAYSGCVAGAAPVADLERMIAAAGFQRVRVTVQAPNEITAECGRSGCGTDSHVASALIEAVKPA